MSLLFIMGWHVKWVAFAVPPLLKKGHSSRLCGDFGGEVMRLLLLWGSMSSGRRAWPQLPLTPAFKFIRTNKFYNFIPKHFV
jgi:hypothetical protein